MKNAGRFLAALACAGVSSAQSPAAIADDPTVSLRQARSLRCTYTANALTAFMPEGRRITTEHDQMVVVYDNIDTKRGTARVIYEKGVVGGGAGDVTARWQANALWLIEAAPKGNLIMTTIFPRFAEGTTDFLALDSRHSLLVIVTGTMASGTCKALT